MTNTCDLERLLETYGDPLLRLCTLYLGDIHLAEDAVQETMLRAWRSWSSYRGEGEKTWLTRIAVNVCRSYLRSPYVTRRAAPEALDSLSSPEPALPDDTLVRAVAALPAKYREVVVLHYYEELTAVEIASLLHRPAATVRVRLKRARELLRTELKGWYYDVDEARA